MADAAILPQTAEVHHSAQNNEGALAGASVEPSDFDVSG
jgi:hypothetical protein